MGDKFVKTIFDKNGKDGRGEWKALFVKDNSDLARAFKSASAAQGLKASAGHQLNVEQIEKRVQDLQEKGGFEDTIEQLNKGRHAIDAKVAAAKVQAVPVTATALRA